jgi:hypothetical protein
MPHHCADAISYQYHGILGFVMSPEGGRLIDIVGTLAGVYAVSPQIVRKRLTAIYWITTVTFLMLALSDGKGMKVAHQLSPCFNFASGRVNAELFYVARTEEKAAPSIRGGFFLLLALMFSLLSVAFREQQCNPPR